PHIARPPGIRDDADGQPRGLPLSDMAPIELADTRGSFPMAHVRHLSYSFARPRYVTDLIGRQIHSPAQVPLVVGLYGDVSRRIGSNCHGGDISSRCFRFYSGLPARRLVDGAAAPRRLPHR